MKKPHKIKIGDDYYEIDGPSTVKITNYSNYRRNIINLVNIEFIKESPKIPFPQSDDLNRFIYIGQTLIKTSFQIKQNTKNNNSKTQKLINGET